MSKDQWIRDHEYALDELWDTGDIDLFRIRMKELGFDDHEIEAEIAACELENEDG